MSEPKVGWPFISWPATDKEVRCAACRRAITCGHGRADTDPTKPGFQAICTDCHWKIMHNIDPDPSAVVPDWAEGIAP